MPDISLPIGAAVTPFSEKISKYFFEETYRASHQYYTNRQNSVDYWKNINENLEISIDAPHVLVNTKSPCVQLAIRTIKGLTRIESQSLLVESSIATTKFQEVLTVKNINEHMTVVSLPSIPLRNLIISEDNFDFTLSKLEIFELDENGKQLDNKVSYKFGNPDLLNDRFVKKWDFFWNLSALDHAYSDLSKRISFHLTSPRKLYGSNSKIPLKDIAVLLVKNFIGRPLNWLVNRSFIMKTLFWIPILLKLKKFDASGENLYLSKEQVKEK